MLLTNDIQKHTKTIQEQSKNNKIHLVLTNSIIRLIFAYFKKTSMAFSILMVFIGLPKSIKSILNIALPNKNPKNVILNQTHVQINTKQDLQ